MSQNLETIFDKQLQNTIRRWVNFNHPNLILDIEDLHRNILKDFKYILGQNSKNNIENTVNEKFISYQKECSGGSSETLPEIDREEFEEADPYKILYRSLAILLSPYYIGDIKFIENSPPTFDQCIEFLTSAHPYFKYIFPDELNQAKSLYEMFFDFYHSKENYENVNLKRKHRIKIG